MPNGDGSYTYTNGDVYTGKWASGVRSGRGTYKFSKDDSFIVGEWEGDSLIRGTWKSVDGAQVRGHCLLFSAVSMRMSTSSAWIEKLTFAPLGSSQQLQEITSSFNGSYPSGLGIIRTATHLSTGSFQPVGEPEDGVPQPTAWKSDSIWQA